MTDSGLFDSVKPAGPAPVAPVIPLHDSYITIECENGSYWVQRVRGERCFAAVRYTRAELVELRRRIDAVLELEGP